MKNRNIVFALVLILILCVPVWSQVTGCLENENNVQGGQLTAGVQFWIQGQFNSHFGWFGWALVNKDWSEIYPGLYWQPTSWMQIGIGAGIERDQSRARVGEFLWMGKGKFYFLAFTEHEGSGFWYRAMAMYQMNKRFQIGLMSQYRLGIGPKVEAVIVKPFSLWVAALAWGEHPKIAAFGGLKLGF